MIIWNNSDFNFPSSNSMELIYLLIDYTIMFLIFVIIFVSFIIIFIIIRKDINNSLLVHHELEIIWSLIPFTILLIICIPTLKSLYNLESCEFRGFSLKVIGYQWYWRYKYDFIENWKMIRYIDLDTYNIRLIDSDNRIIMPLNIPFNLIVTSNDVIHSWTIPSAGVKIDAIPGRINQISVSIKKLGKFFGQCSEICGANHSFMPISIEVVKGSSFLNILK